MKRLSLILVSVILFSIGIHAQDRPEQAGEQISPQQRAENFVNKLNEKIHLNKVKSDSVAIAFKNFYEAMQTYQTDGNVEVVKLLVQRRDKTVQNVLANDDQYATYVKLLDDLKKQRQQQREQNGSQGGHRNGGMGRPGMGGGMGGMRQPGF